MPLNIRGDQGCYAPDRDLINAYPQAIDLAVKRFNAKSWPELHELAEANGVDWEQLCDTMYAFTEFMVTSIDDPSVTMEEMMRRSGFFEGKPMARVAVMAMIGSVVIGQLYHAVRETTPLGAIPEPMGATAERMRALIANGKSVST